MTTADPMADLEVAVQRAANDQEAAKVMSTARARMLLRKDAQSPFFAAVGLQLAMAPDRTVPTACTDGATIRFNPDFVVGLKRDEVLGLFAHEILHVVLGHHLRMGIRDPGQWNLACDLAINPILRDAGYTLPPGGIYPGRGVYQHLPQGLAAEEYYRLLPEDGSAGNGPGPGDVATPGAGTPADLARAESQHRETLAMAHTSVKLRGLDTSGIDRFVNAALAPKANWRSELADFCTRAARSGQTWSPPNRRHAWAGLCLPSRRSQTAGRIGVLVDTSGSVGATELASFAAELRAIAETVLADLVILYHDSQVCGEQRWEPGDGDLVLTPHGGGGTDHRPALAALADLADPIDCCVAFTDLQSRFPDEPPPFPVLWAVTGKCREASFGRVITIEP